MKKQHLILQNKNTHLFWQMLVCCCFGLMLTACGRQTKMNELQQYVAQLKEAAAVRKHADFTVETPKPVTYQSAGIRNPFQEGEMENKKLGETKPLAGYPLSMLRFIGTMEQDKEILGFIQAPDNKVYPVKMGDLIGDQLGKVTNIFADHLEVLEQIHENGEVISQRLVNIYISRKEKNAG